jgi:hypothetical protein
MLVGGTNSLWLPPFYKDDSILESLCYCETHLSTNAELFFSKEIFLCLRTIPKLVFEV